MEKGWEKCPIQDIVIVHPGQIHLSQTSKKVGVVGKKLSWVEIFGEINKSLCI